MPLVQNQYWFVRKFCDFQQALRNNGKIINRHGKVKKPLSIRFGRRVKESENKRYTGQGHENRFNKVLDGDDNHAGSFLGKILVRFDVAERADPGQVESVDNKLVDVADSDALPVRQNESPRRLLCQQFYSDCPDVNIDLKEFKR